LKKDLKGEQYMFTEKTFLLKINYSYEYDNIEQEIVTTDFIEPTIENIEDISTSKQVLFFLSEIFGDSIYDFLTQDIIENIEESNMEDICEIIIISYDDEVTFSIDVNKKNIEIT
jgi:hypothetical protein